MSKLELYVKEKISGYVTYFDLPLEEGLERDHSDFLIPPGEEMTIIESQSTILVNSNIDFIYMTFTFAFKCVADDIYRIEIVEPKYDERYIIKYDQGAAMLEPGRTEEIHIDIHDSNPISDIYSSRKACYSFKLEWV